MSLSTQEYGNYVCQQAIHRMWKHQVEAMNEIRKHQDARAPTYKNYKSTIILPTGTGKSGIALLLPYWLKSRRALVITPRTILRNQLYEAAVDSNIGQEKRRSYFDKYGILPKDKAYMRTGFFYAKDATALFDNVESHSCVFANGQMVTNREEQTRSDWQTILQSEHFDLVIVDEAHYHPSATWNAICEHFQSSKVVFMTATPYRTDREAVCDKEHFCYHMKRSTAVENNIIRDFTKDVVRWTEADDAALEEGGQTDAAEQHLIHLALLKKIKNVLDERDLSHPLPDGLKHKALMMVGNETDKHMSRAAYDLETLCQRTEELRDLNAKAYVSGCIGYSSNDKKQKKSDIQLKGYLNAFTRKEGFEPSDPRLLIVNNKLREGFDYAGVSVVCISRAMDAYSPDFEQFMGRAVRRFGESEPAGLTAVLIYHDQEELGEQYTKYKEDKNYMPYSSIIR